MSDSTMVPNEPDPFPIFFWFIVVPCFIAESVIILGWVR